VASTATGSLPDPVATRRKRGTAVLIVGAVLTAVFSSGLLAAFAILVVSGVFAAVFPAVFGTPFDDLALDRRAQVCSGEMILVEEDSSLRVQTENTVRLGYRYDPGDGPREGESRVVASDGLAALAPGDTVDIEYLPDDPAVSRVRGSKAHIAGWGGAIGYGFGGMGLLVFVAAAVPVGLGMALMAVGLWLRRRPP